MDMDALLSMIVSITVVAGFLWSIVHYVIKKEMGTLVAANANLQASIHGLDKSIAKMTIIAEQTQAVQHDMDKRLAVHESKVTALHERMDDFDHRLIDFCRFCNHEHKGDMPGEVYARITTPHRRKKGEEA
jgi:hypothetical protein